MNIYEIAEKAGVSISSVSRVLNNKPGVNPEARARVLEVVKNSGYSPNLLARELANQKTSVIGIVLPGINSFFTERIEAIHDLCREKHYSVMITSNFRHKNDFGEELENLHLLFDRRVDGIIYFVSRLTPEQLVLLEVINKTIPIVSADCEIPDSNIPCILQDNRSGAIKAAQHLLEKGHRNITVITGPDYSTDSQERLEAFLATLARNRITLSPENILEGRYSKNSGFTAMRDWIAAGKELPTAVFALNDDMGIGAIREIRDAGYRVPEDISVIGYDDIDICPYLSPALTTVRQNNYETGKATADLLFELIESRNTRVKKIYMEQNLIIRDSVRDIKKDI